MAHETKQVYQEEVTGIIPEMQSWVAECLCGWKEKAMLERTVRYRLGQHIEMPNRR